MPLTSKQKAEIVKNNNNNTGSTVTQIELLTARIIELAKHVKDNKKDYSASRAIKKLVAIRKRLMQYLKNRDEAVYLVTVKRLNLRN